MSVNTLHICPKVLCFFVLLLVPSVFANKQISVIKQSPPRESLKRWEIRTAPIALIAQWQTLDVSYRVNPNFSFGPAVIKYNADLGSMFFAGYSGSAYGVTANYYFDSVMKKTWYLSTHAYSETVTIHPHAGSSRYENKGYKINAAIGYQFKMLNFANLMLGAGSEYRDYQTNEINMYDGINKEYSSKKTIPFLECKLGIEF